MKNVAGYDVSRLMAGSWGVLGDPLRGVIEGGGHAAANRHPGVRLRDELRSRGSSPDGGPCRCRSMRALARGVPASTPRGSHGGGRERRRRLGGARMAAGGRLVGGRARPRPRFLSTERGTARERRVPVEDLGAADHAAAGWGRTSLNGAAPSAVLARAEAARESSDARASRRRTCDAGSRRRQIHGCLRAWQSPWRGSTAPERAPSIRIVVQPRALVRRPVREQMQTKLSTEFEGTALGLRRIPSCEVRALRVLQCHVPDLSVARRRARWTPRTDLSHQGNARRGTRSGEPPSAISTAASPAATARPPAERRPLRPSARDRPPRARTAGRPPVAREERPLAAQGEPDLAPVRTRPADRPQAAAPAARDVARQDLAGCPGRHAGAAPARASSQSAVARRLRAARDAPADPPRDTPGARRGGHASRRCSPREKAAAERCDTHLADRDGGLADMRRNIDAWWPMASSGAVESIVVNASGCGQMVKEYAHALRDEPAYAERAVRIVAMTRDLGRLLPELAPALEGRLRTGGAPRLAFHSPCTLQHGQRIHGGDRGAAREPRLRGPAGRGPRAICAADPRGPTRSCSPSSPARCANASSPASWPSSPECIVSANIGCIQHLAGRHEHSGQALDRGAGRGARLAGD